MTTLWGLMLSPIFKEIPEIEHKYLGLCSKPLPAEAFHKPLISFLCFFSFPCFKYLIHYFMYMGVLLQVF